MRIIHRLAPSAKPTIDDMLIQVFRTCALIEKASTDCMLILLESKIEQIAHYYRGIEKMPYWVNKMHTVMLRRRCDLLTLHPEEA